MTDDGLIFIKKNLISKIKPSRKNDYTYPSKYMTKIHSTL